MPQGELSEPARLLALGDSYTIGEGVVAGRRWPDLLVAELRKSGVDISDAEIIATTGWTTDELLHGIEARQPTPPFALVSLLVGVNNQYRARSLDNYRQEFGVLLEFAISMAGGCARRVLVVSIPDWGITPFAAVQGADRSKVAREIDRFNDVNRELAENRGVRWIDVTDISRESGRNLLVEDGLHPSAEQYALWVARMLPVAESIVRA